MRYQAKKTLLDAATILALRRAEILSEYRFHDLDPIRIGTEPISMEYISAGDRDRVFAEIDAERNFGIFLCAVALIFVLFAPAIIQAIVP